MSRIVEPCSFEIGDIVVCQAGFTSIEFMSNLTQDYGGPGYVQGKTFTIERIGWMKSGTYKDSCVIWPKGEAQGLFARTCKLSNEFENIINTLREEIEREDYLQNWLA